MRYNIKFYKADSRSAQWYDKLVALFTGGPYSHVEIHEPETDVILRVSPRVGGATLVNKPHYNDNNWNTIVVEHTREPFDKMLEIASEKKEYNYIGAVISALDKLCWFKNDKKIFCSEAVAECLGIGNACSFSPNELYEYLEESIDG